MATALVLSVLRAFSPLDEELALPDGQLSPRLEQALVRLGVWMPFEQARELLADLLGVQISEPTTRRRTEQAGALLVELQSEQVAEIERTLPQPPPGPAKLYFSADGAMVPLLGGVWAEVKTLVLGEVVQEASTAAAIRTRDLSYFSRLSDATTLERLSIVETQRRGVERAGAIAAVMDGAEWEQGLIDHHCPRAVRILDYAHAVEHINQISQAAFGANTTAAAQWLGLQAVQLKEHGPAAVLAEIRALQASQPQREEISSHLAYLQKREGQMQYPAFVAAGWPIGSGATESANKLVVEARLKGAGMHWAREHVNPMLSLRNAVCNRRWAEAWGELSECRRQKEQQRRQRRQSRQGQDTEQEALASSTAKELDRADSAATINQQLMEHVVALLETAQVETMTEPAKPVKPAQPWRPAADHPWRRSPIGSARYQQPRSRSNAKE